MKNYKIKLMCVTAVFTALIYLFTAYLHIPSHTGYIHIGDGFIYLASCLLPLPYAVFAGSVGALLADCLSGFAVWAPGSVIIKAVSVLLFCRKGAKIIMAKNLLALIPAWLVCIGGYYLYEAVIVGNFISPLAGIWGYVVQSVLSSVLFVFLGAALDRFDFKEKILFGE